jgi:uridylate kinase
MARKARPVYKRIILKISGEGLCQPGGFGLDADQLERIGKEIREVARVGAQLAVVVGGGNFLRGSTAAKQARVPEATAHHMGMLATVINALALQEVIEALGLHVRVMSAIAVAAVCEPYIRRRCIRHLEKERVVILAGGTGRPFVTTDTAAALAAMELGADAVLKATKVDGVYSADPKTNPRAKFYPHLTYDRAINERLGVMDLSAIDLCRQKHIPVIVFNMAKPGNMKRVVLGAKVGTLVTGA